MQQPKSVTCIWPDGSGLVKYAYEFVEVQAVTESSWVLKAMSDDKLHGPSALTSYIHIESMPAALHGEGTLSCGPQKHELDAAHMCKCLNLSGKF